MLFALVHIILRRLFGVASGSESQSHSKDVETLVLRHQLKVLGIVEREVHVEPGSKTFWLLWWAAACCRHSSSWLCSGSSRW